MLRKSLYLSLLCDKDISRGKTEKKTVRTVTEQVHTHPSCLMLTVKVTMGWNGNSPHLNHLAGH